MFSVYRVRENIVVVLELVDFRKTSKDLKMRDVHVDINTKGGSNTGCRSGGIIDWADMSQLVSKIHPVCLEKFFLVNTETKHAGVCDGCRWK